MRKKLISLLLLSFLLVGITSFALNTRAVAESVTVHIRSDGSIDPPAAPVSSLDNVTYELTDNIRTNSTNAVVIERNNTVLDGAGFTLTGTNQGGSCGIHLTGISNVTIRNTSIQSFYDGIYEEGCSNCQIMETSLSFDGNGIHLESSDFNTIEGNNIANNTYAGIWLEISKNNNISGNRLANTISSNHIGGIYLQDCSNNNNIFGNNLTDNIWYGIYIWNSGFNTIFHNNFINNTFQAYCLESFGNSWNDSYPSGGNYWNDYIGVDNRSGPYQSQLGSDGIGDSPYTIDVTTSDIDHYPLMKAYSWSPLAVNTTPVSVTMDVGQSQLFTSTVSGGRSPFNYQWYLNDVVVPEATSPAWTFVPDSPGSYNAYVDVTDSLGLTAKSDTTTVIVNLALSVSILPTLAVMDVGQSQLFTSSISGGTSPYTYQWYLAGVAVSGATNATWTFTPSSTGSYMIHVEIIDSIRVQATSGTTNVTVRIRDVAVTDVAPSKTVVGQGCALNTTVKAEDLGDYPETFNVTVYANITSVDSQNVTLTSENFTTVTFTWNTTGLAYGNYTISAYAWPVLGETNTADNNCTGGWVIIAIPGDIAGNNSWPDGKVDMKDIATVAAAFGSTLGNSNWNPNADLNNDGRIDMKDISMVAAHFGNTDP